MANDHDDTSFVVLENPCCRTLHNLTIRGECCAEGNVDAAGNVASAEAGIRSVKEHGLEQVQHLSGTRALDLAEWLFFNFAATSMI